MLSARIVLLFLEKCVGEVMRAWGRPHMGIPPAQLTVLRLIFSSALF